MNPITITDVLAVVVFVVTIAGIEVLFWKAWRNRDVP